MSRSPPSNSLNAVCCSGFKTSSIDNVNLSASEEIRVDAALTVGQMTDRITVSESAISLKSEDATVATTLGRDQIIVHSYPTQKLRVRFHSIETIVSQRNHRRDHLVLTAL